MDKWLVVIEAWPYFGCKQEDAGKRRETYTIAATSAHEALMKADLIVRGIKRNPAVWEAPIVSLNQADK